MTGKTRGIIGLLAVLVLGSGCKAAVPFDQIKDAGVIAFRLQNYEPVAAAPTAVGATAAPVIPGVPAEIQQWIQQGAQGLSQLIPPGLVPEGLIPGLAPATGTPAPAADTALRFPETAPNFRVLSQTQVVDPALKKQLMRVFGKKSHFQSQHATCLYAEFGIRFATATAPANDVLVSFSCNQVAARGFAWPYPNTGLKPATVEKLATVINKLFPPGT